jgi:hypothetical protein
MTFQSQNLTRAELYEKVWTTPMRTLAKEFGLSDVGLAKLCRRHDIPTPGLGYWRLVETGHPPSRVPLPPVESPNSERVTIAAHEPQPFDIPRKSERTPSPKIQVQDDREITHPLALRTKKLFEPTSKDDRGRFIPAQLKASHLQVSKNSMPRALRILDALFFAVEAQGCTVEWGNAPDARLSILLDGEKLYFSLAESFSRKPHTPTPAEAARKQKEHYVYTSQWDFEPTGVLHLSIDNLPYDLQSVRKSWSDGRFQRIEKCLSDCVAILPHLTKAIKIVHEENRRRQIQREEEAKRREEAQRRQFEYDRKAKVSEEFLAGWTKSREFHEFANALITKTETSTLDDDVKKELRKISHWLARHAEYLDPLTDFKWMIKKFKNSDGYGDDFDEVEQT